MEVTQTTILDLLSDSANGLAIPSYQRVYSWTTRQCEELWLDVLRAGRDSRPHFTGVMLFEGEGVADGDVSRLPARRQRLRAH